MCPISKLLLKEALALTWINFKLFSLEVLVSCWACNNQYSRMLATFCKQFLEKNPVDTSKSALRFTYNTYWLLNILFRWRGCETDRRNDRDITSTLKKVWSSWTIEIGLGWGRKTFEKNCVSLLSSLLSSGTGTVS